MLWLIINHNAALSWRHLLWSSFYIWACAVISLSSYILTHIFFDGLLFFQVTPASLFSDILLHNPVLLVTILSNRSCSYFSIVLFSMCYPAIIVFALFSYHISVLFLCVDWRCYISYLLTVFCILLSVHCNLSLPYIMRSFTPSSWCRFDQRSTPLPPLIILTSLSRCVLDCILGHLDRFDVPC